MVAYFLQTDRSCKLLPMFAPRRDVDMSNNFIQHYSVETQMALEIRVEPLFDDMGL